MDKPKETPLDDAQFESDAFYPKFMRGALALFAAMMAVSVAIGLIQGQANAVIPAALAGVFVFLFVKSRGKMGVVTAGKSGVAISQAGKTFVLDWSAVTSLRSIPFVSPPLYRMTCSEAPFVTMFVPRSGFTLNIGVWSWEFSKMAKYMREQMSRG